MERTMPYLRQKAYALISEALEEIVPLPSRKIRLEHKIHFVDVGASKGIQPKWLRQKDNIIPVLFEPNPEEARRLRDQLSAFEKSFVIETGLADRNGPQQLHIGEHYGCTSILEANSAFLSDYQIAASYHVKDTVEIECARYDGLVGAGKAPVPDVIKIDVEGYESHVLEGFGSLLHNVVGIETEVFFYPVYKRQALFHDLIAQLEPFGLRLKRIEEVPAFDGDLVCANAYFMKDRVAYARLSMEGRAKYDLAAHVFQITERPLARC
ncbi:FkbM family methyltransferase [Methylobacterium sp. HMF5984]|uniref:FkbM family methyltransferase n=1 Tax=Methylobacterium sp. HMF5984 TaxID=3367370 RepID=UPI0038518A6E